MSRYYKTKRTTLDYIGIVVCSTVVAIVLLFGAYWLYAYERFGNWRSWHETTGIITGVDTGTYLGFRARYILNYEITIDRKSYGGSAYYTASRARQHVLDGVLLPGRKLLVHYYPTDPSRNVAMPRPLPN